MFLTEFRNLFILERCRLGDLALCLVRIYRLECFHHAITIVLLCDWDYLRLLCQGKEDQIMNFSRDHRRCLLLVFSRYDQLYNLFIPSALLRHFLQSFRSREVLQEITNKTSQ